MRWSPRLKTPQPMSAFRFLVEGYAPPYDSRVNAIKVTPDPGVIEVNLHPSANWDELVKNTTALYEEARLSRLGTEKFMLDGRHTGTGGGNHILVGGACPADSPLLRNPGLLRSLIGYWHNHPALSYLFSGVFVGPTSQAPRFDEARNDQVYEMEIAFQQIPEGKAASPWIVDRVFRDLLIDAAGSTHRAEFSIDKLYPPDSASSRLGLLEMRAFEMPPHSRMSLTQHLLLRSLIAKFWKNPYHEELVRWRTEIHDRFMLPYFLRMDLEDVVADLNEAGYPLKVEWFAPHFEFRFPFYGKIEHRGIEMEFRQAIEPWHVMGEEASRGRDVASRGFLPRTAAGAGDGNGRSAARRHVQRQARSASPDRDERRIRGGRSLSRLAAAALPASDNQDSLAAGIRHRGHMVGADRSAGARITWSIPEAGVTIVSR